MSRLEKLIEKMHREEAAAATKTATPKPRAVKPKVAPKSAKLVAKPAPQPEPEVSFVVPPMTLSSCVEQLTSSEIADPANFVRTLCLHVLTEIAACPNPTLKALTDDRLEDFAALLAEIWTERPNIKKASILAHRLVDSIEMHTTAFEDESKLGSSIRRLMEIERLLAAQRAR